MKETVTVSSVFTEKPGGKCKRSLWGICDNRGQYLEVRLARQLTQFCCHLFLSIPLENIRKPIVFLVFSRGVKREQWHEISFNNNSCKRTQNFPKTNISYLLIRTRKCAYQGVRSVSFSKDFEINVLNEWSPSWSTDWTRKERKNEVFIDWLTCIVNKSL